MAEETQSTTGSGAAESPVTFQTPADVRVDVDGNEITVDISNVKLVQDVERHHVLTVRIRHVGISGSNEFEDTSTYTSFLGKPITLEIRPESRIVDSRFGLVFIGLVTEVRLDNGIDGINTVVLTAHSPTIALDTLPKNKVFTAGSDTGTIVGEILSNYEITQGHVESVDVASAPASLNQEVDSTVQYRETDFAYIKRLASEHQMWAYYDGTAFNVEKAQVNSQRDLMWRETLGAFALGLGTAPLNYAGRVWDAGHKQAVDSRSDKSSIRSSLSDMSGVAVEGSDRIYTTVGISSAPKHANAAKADAAVARETEAAAGRAVTCTATSIVPAVMVGSCVMISGMGDQDGQYWVKSICHHLNDAGQYHNTFVCTPLELALPPRHHERQSVTHMQTGLVVDNEDPQGLGRVKVKLHWHDDTETQFMRMVTPDGGPERGWFALPEINDEVLVGYERGNPDMPVVLGCLYNGEDYPPMSTSDAVSGGKVEKKLYRTRRGNEIIFEETDGAEKITIQQQDSQNMIVLNVDGPKIVIESAGDILMKGANIELESTSGDITIKSAANLKGEASADVDLKATGNFKSEGGMNYEAKGGVGFKASGTQTSVEGSAMTEIKGGIVKIN